MIRPVLLLFYLTLPEVFHLVCAFIAYNNNSDMLNLSSFSIVNFMTELFILICMQASARDPRL
ncbi:hypothetical protein BDZ91DRAFT_168992 [Kalaharituber pfeilii]|nr:hypothetical protein BDZ91DRAFT_168992 [Kalaharituber pfeilii]